MPKARIHNLTMSLDGFVAGPRQRLDAPLGEGGERLHAWVFANEYGRRMLGQEGGATGVDNDYLIAGDENVGATIIGRNMFGPIRGPWSEPDSGSDSESDSGESDEWRGWWGPNPPYHHDVFVLTHHARPPLPMEGGTTFYFVTEPADAVLELAFAAAGGRDVRIGGGAATARQFLQAGLVDEMHLAIVPTFLGDGERIFDGWPALPEQYECRELSSSNSSATGVVHVRIVKRG